MARPSIARELSPADRRLIAEGCAEAIDLVRSVRADALPNTEAQRRLDDAVEAIEDAVRCFEVGE